MYDKCQKVCGVLLVFISLLFFAAGLFPLPESVSVSMHSRGNNFAELPFVPHLDEYDIFNIGNAEELAKLPGIGKVTAAQIIEEREKNGLFIYAEDIMSVKGIGDKKLIQLYPFLCISSGEREE